MYFVVHYDLVIRTDPRAIGRFKLFTISSYYSHDCFDQNTFCVFLSLRFRLTNYLHTGSFAPNSFQIDSINSCSTSKKLQF